MKVLGYTTKRQVVGVELSPAKVVSLGIDASVMDLFHETPVAHECAGEKLLFQPLERFALMEQSEEHDCARIAIRTRQRQVAYAAEVSSAHSTLENVRPIEPCFNELYERYLSADPCVTRIEPEVIFQDGRLRILKDSHLRSDRSPVHSYRGNTMQVTECDLQTPDSVNWLLDELRWLEPVVLSRTAVEILCGKSLSSVEFQFGKPHKDVMAFLDNQKLAARECNPLGTRGFQFKRNGITYFGLESAHPGEYLSDQLRMPKANTMSGPYIALYDAKMGRKRRSRGDLEQLDALGAP